MNENVMDMIYWLRMYARDKRRSEYARNWLTEIEACLIECNEERKRYKEELDDLKGTLKKLVDMIQGG